MATESKCQKCVYRSGRPEDNVCDYMYLTGMPRGCPGDENCKRFKKGPRKRLQLTLPGSTPLEEPKGDRDFQNYDGEKRHRIYGYKEALRKYAEKKM